MVFSEFSFQNRTIKLTLRMIEARWFWWSTTLGALGLIATALRGGLTPGGRRGPLPLTRPAVLAAALAGGGLGGLVAAGLFQIYPRELLLGSSISGGIVAALATAYALW